MSLDQARRLQSAFRGRITSSHPQDAELAGALGVLIPESLDDVARAVRLARAAGRALSVQSGLTVSTDLPSAAEGALVGAGIAAAVPPRKGALVSMEAFKGVVASGPEQRVTVGVAATMGDVARALARENLFLPLEDTPNRSIVSAILQDVRAFPRSGPHSPLRDAIVQAEAVLTDGDQAGLPRQLTGHELAQLWAAGRRPLLAQVVMDASRYTEAESTRWALARMTAYDPAKFGDLCDRLFEADGIPAKVDLSVRITSAAYGMTLVIIRGTGHGSADRDVTKGRIRESLALAGCAELSAQDANGPGSSISTWVMAGASAASATEVTARFGPAAPRAWSALRQDLLDAMDSIGLGRGVDGWAELQLTPSGTIEPLVEVVGGAATVAEHLAPVAVTGSGAVEFAFVGPAADTVEGFDLFGTNRAGSGIIPWFQGDVFARSKDKADYRRAIEQYAVSSYDITTVQARMMPAYVAEPRDADDVVRAVRFAASKGLKVVARSGGHQYCGLSSGGADTLVLDMVHFWRATFHHEEHPTRVMVEPGVRLKDLSKKLRDKHVVIPHGECPLVGLGGHVQTGGVGHQLRSLGLALDYVSSFEMVTGRRNEHGALVYDKHTFNRPAGIAPPAGGVISDDDVFRAVLGGGPGSWGVLTKITFDLVSDSDEEALDSHGYTRTYLYKKAASAAAMEQLRRWADRAAAGTLPEGVDLFISIISGGLEALPLVRPSVLLIEAMALSQEGVAEIDAVLDAIEATGAVALDGVLGRSINGPTPLSVIAHEGVRRLGLLGGMPDGREFLKPYKKSMHVTTQPFTSSFAEAFVDLVDAVIHEDGVHVVVQAPLGGGKFASNGKDTTYMQRRDALVQLVFDVFYDEGKEDVADAFQAQMKSLVPQFSGGDDLRMFWGTFDDAGTSWQLDMGLEEVQRMYYDDPLAYQRLQKVKRYVDPKDVFHTSFTVRLPES